VVKAWHQVRWIINPNNCTIVGANPAPSHILPAAAAAPQGAAPSDAAQNEADDTSSESSESDGDGEAEIDAPMEAVPAVPGAQQDSLCPHGLRWTLENEPISIDAREGSNFTPSMRWKRSESTLPERTPLIYFTHFLPQLWEEKIPYWTSAQLIAKRKAPMDRDEFRTWLGILLATTFAPGRSVKDMWTVQDLGFFPPACTRERHGMSRDRWEAIKSCLTFTPPEPTADLWKCRWLIDTFNDWMDECFSPGYKIVVDESMFEWRGRGDYDIRGLPHKSKVIRKPKGVGLELKNALCVQSGVMLRYEMLEGKAAMANRRFCGPGVNNSTATTLRLVEPWLYKGRHVLGDSWFASVQTALHLKLKGTFFTGMVKTAHREFVKDFIQKEAFDENSARGATVTLTAEKKGVKLIAHGWNEPGKKDKPRKALISTCGVTTAADKSLRRRWILNPETAQMEPKTLEIPQTHLVKDYFDGAQGIDVFNHHRQGGLRLEALNTSDCWFRVFECMVGTLETSSFNAYRYFEAGKQDEVHGAFTEVLAMQLTGFRPAGIEHVSTAKGKKRKQSESSKGKLCIKHTILKLKDASHFQKKIKAAEKEGGRYNAHNKCSMCGHDCYFYCKECSAVGGRVFMNLCGPTSGRQCISQHIHDRLLGAEEDEDEA